MASIRFLCVPGTAPGSAHLAFVVAGRARGAAAHRRRRDEAGIHARAALPVPPEPLQAGARTPASHRDQVARRRTVEVAP